MLTGEVLDRLQYNYTYNYTGIYLVYRNYRYHTWYGNNYTCKVVAWQHDYAIYSILYSIQQRRDVYCTVIILVYMVDIIRT